MTEKDYSLIFAINELMERFARQVLCVVFLSKKLQFHKTTNARVVANCKGNLAKVSEGYL